MARTEIETGRTLLLDGVYLVDVTITYDMYSGGTATYDTHRLDGLDDNAVVALSELAAILKVVDNIDVDGIDLEDYLKDYARDLAEDAELPFTFEDSYGSSQTYTPASLWESSGGCEWETSAQEGYDFGWNV